MSGMKITEVKMIDERNLNILNVDEKTIKRDIKSLKKQELLKRVGPPRGGYWKL